MDRRQLAIKIRTARFHNVYSQEALEAIAQSGSQIIMENASVAILCNEGTFYRIYWGIDDKKDIIGLKAKIADCTDNRPYISEIIFRKQEPDIVSEFLDAGMIEYRRLSFMVRPAAPVSQKINIFTRDNHKWDICCEKANLNDVDVLRQLLWANFDPLVSHLPDYVQITELINKEEINILRLNGKIAVAAIFQITGRFNKYWYQLITAPKCRGRGLADYLLLNELLQNGSGYSYSLWVEKNNYKAMNMHRKHGFVDAGRELIILRGN